MIIIIFLNYGRGEIEQWEEERERDARLLYMIIIIFLNYGRGEIEQWEEERERDARLF
jgi:hypothetical protein